MQGNGFRKVLVANRAEIAIRVARACKELGKKVVAIHTPQDREGLWTYMTDEVYEVGNYLDIDEIIRVAKKSGADAIHPGYGFLSEKEEFAKECERAGIKFIGPSPESLRLSGDKVMARQKAEEAGIPTVPGSSSAVENPDEALRIAREVGFPVLLKAAGGGGGKGMRPVFSEQEFKESFLHASAEAKNAFGDPRIYIEKYIEEPKHIEIQVLADEHGNYIYLFERDCSLQRRNQKIIEESPSPLLPDDVRLRMCESAVAVMKKIGYFNAGTVEFIVDKNWNFYFIEINARIQVEHPVTEMVTGIDLVKRQILIAEGKKLDILQEDVKVSGHAMELRIYAEDPEADFMPSGGSIANYREPSMPGVRCDGWLYPGCKVPSEYDPMLLKLIAKGERRDETINKLLLALDELKIQGIKNNIPFLRFVLELPEFRRGDINTWSIKNILEKYKKGSEGRDEEIVRKAPRKLKKPDGELSSSSSAADEHDTIKEHIIILGAYLSKSSTILPNGRDTVSNAEGKSGWRITGWKLAGRLY